MSDEKKTGDELVVLAGSVTVLRQVGAGMAYVDVLQGEPVGDVDDETRERLLKSNAIGRRDGAPYEAAARPVPGLVEPDEIDPDVIPAGSAEQVLEWVGEDLARARVAIHEETAKGLNARQGLIAELEKVAAGLESDPPRVPEHLDESQVSPAPAGGVAVPDVEAAPGQPAEQDGQPGQTRTARTARAGRSSSK